MNKIIAIVMIALAVVCRASAQPQSATLVASGLTCSMCSKAIYKALEKVPYISSIDVDIEKSSYEIRFKPGMDIEPDEMKKAVEGAGFFVASLQLRVKMDGVDVKNDAHVTFAGATYHFVKVPEKTVSGEATLTVIDKNYLPAKARKKYDKFTSMECYETGVAMACCAHKGKTNRIYHVTM